MGSVVDDMEKSETFQYDEFEEQNLQNLSNLKNTEWNGEKKELDVRDFWDKNKTANIHILGSQIKQKESRTEKVFKKIMDENSLILAKDRSL